MKFSSLPSDRACCSRKERGPNLLTAPNPFFILCFVCVTTVFTFFLCSPNPFDVMTSKHALTHNKTMIKPHKDFDDEQTCDLSKGHWIPDFEGSRYTNLSCSTIPVSKNCFRHGRTDVDFVKWRWKPDGCELPRFDPKAFLTAFRGKKLAFVGDSVARNHMESLLCLLSQEEVPRDIYKDSEDRFRTWYFTHYGFTLSILWSKFLVSGEERIINGSASGIIDLHLDKIDNKWAPNIATVDCIIISDAHWFFRQMYLYESEKVVGCVYCNEPNMTDLGLGYALRMSFRRAFDYINGCEECKDKGMVTLVRTFSPAHFENGTWDTGGKCERTSPDLGGGEEVELGSSLEWELRTIQLEEVERARLRGEKRFEALDVTRAMLMRPDGHPGAHWGNKWMKGYNDCVHWCMPGPIDAWNDFLMEVLIGRQAGLFS